MAASHSVDVERWQAMSEGLMGRVAGRFARVEPRRRARSLVLGLLSDLPRKNCWTIAEHAGDTTPHGMQHLLSRAQWDADTVRDDIRTYVVDHLRDEEAVLVVDETGDQKKGATTVGVQRQYTGTAGRIENAQVAVYLVYSARAGHAAIDRELYVPRSWTEDRQRCASAGIPAAVGFATKPALAAQMIARALDSGVAARWVAGDEVYGGNPTLHTALEHREIGYVLAVACDHQIATSGGRLRASALVNKMPKACLAEALGRGRGEGPPLLRLGRGRHRRRPPRTPPAPGPPKPAHTRTRLLPLLFAHRRSTVHTRTGSRAQVDSRGDLPDGKGTDRIGRTPGPPVDVLAPLGHLAMLAHAFLAVVTADERTHRPAPDGLIPLSINEIAHLFNRLIVRPAHAAAHRLRCSHWRRRHQARARDSHYLRQAAAQP